MDEQQMDKDINSFLLVNGDQIDCMLHQFESEQQLNDFITEFVQSFDFLSDIFEKKTNNKETLYVGSILYIISFFSKYSQIINRLSQIFSPKIISKKQKEFLQSHGFGNIKEFKNGEIV